ncbi:MAG: hypothetical protein RLZZ15_3103 [Verrucomicrobiota bacterium]
MSVERSALNVERSGAAGPAVFLSYASQDAEAVLRIAEALRSAGVEVWFDRDELVGGDAWDAKIRKQIADCALFVPIISAATQARTEGYFRLEWKLAAQRTHMIADDAAFLLPVVIDETRDADARVPAEFKSVQWTRLPGGESAAKFCARVQTLLGSAAADAGPVTNRAPGQQPGQQPKVGRRAPAPAWIAAVAIVVAVALYFALRPAAPPAGAGTRTPATEKSTAPTSEARALLPKIWALLNRPELARAELDAADALCKQAVTLDQADADIWAAWSYADVWFVWYGFDITSTRQESARDKSARAMRLDPKSYEARLAHANYLVRCVWQKETAATTAGEAEPILRDLLRERPDEPRVLYLQGMFVFLKDNLSEDKSALERMEKNPSFAVAASKEIGWQHYWAGRWAKADEAADRSIALQPYWDNLGLKIQLARRWHGDLALAKSALNRLPPSALREVGSEGIAWGVLGWRRDTDEMLAFLGSIPREWISIGLVMTPKSFHAGQARLLARQPEVARREFRRALDLIEPRLALEPNNAELLGIKAMALLYLDERTEAERNYRLSVAITPPPVDLLALFETPDAAIAELEARARKGVDFFSQWFIDLTAASLRLNPAYDPLRNHPSFAALLASADLDPLRSPKAKAALPTPTAKSVAVLAFKNLSGDPAREFFSDGLSEAVTDVLGRVPGLKVVGSASAFSFKGKSVPIPEIARQLGVTHLVDGTVIQDGPTVRITTKLIQADGFQVWVSEKLDRELKNIFALHDEVAGLIAKNLSLKLGVATGRQKREVNPEAYQLYIQARQNWNLRASESLTRAEELLGRALALEPDYAQAHTALADVWIARGGQSSVLGTFSQRQSPERPRIMAKIEQALDLDPDSAEARASLGAASMYDWDFVKAERELHRAIAQNPNYASSHQWLGRVLLAQGRMEEALAQLRRATEADPLSPIVLVNYCGRLIEAGRHTEALAVAERASLLHRDSRTLLAHKGYALLGLARNPEATVLARQLAAIDPSDPNVVFPAAFILASAGATAEADTMMATLPPRGRFPRTALLLALGRRQEAIAALDAPGHNVNYLGLLLFDRCYDPIRSEPRFTKFLAELGLTEAHARAQAWRKAHPPEKPASK